MSAYCASVYSACSVSWRRAMLASMASGNCHRYGAGVAWLAVANAAEASPDVTAVRRARSAVIQAA